MSVWSTCRVCLASDRQMYHLANTALEETYERVTSETLVMEGRPCCVCGLCLSALRRCRRFIDTAREANDALDRWIWDHPNTKTSKLTERPLFSFTQGITKFFEFTCLEPRVKQETYRAENENPTKTHHQDNLGTLDDKGNIPVKEIKCEVTSDDDNDNTQISDNIGSHNTQVPNQFINVYNDIMEIENDPQKSDVKFEITEILDNAGDETASVDGRSNQGTSDEEIPLLRSRKRVKPSENIENVIVVGRKVEVESQPSTSQSNLSRTSINVNDTDCDATVDDWIHADDSDVDMEIDLNEDICLLPVDKYPRDATTEPTCDTDMTELQARVLQAEDELNDRHLRDRAPTDDYYQFDWKKDRSTFTGRRETFTGLTGPTFDVTDMTPVDIFYKMFDTDFIDNICTETNRYAEQKIAYLKSENKISPTSRLHRWTPTDRDEMITFLAILILQGLYPLPEEEKYFMFNGFGTMPYFRRIMSYNRFLLLKSLYHFVDNQTTTDRSKLCKIQPVLDYFNDKFSTLYMPSQEIAIDESLLKWHGRLSFAQKIATKAAQVGVKTYELCESQTGYLWKFIVYVGKNTETIPTNDRPVDEETIDRPANDLRDPDTETHDPTVDQVDSSCARPTSATAKIVFDLVEPLLHRGHTIIMDNFYNSPLLLRCLKRLKTDCFGTLRLNREFVPESLKTLTKNDLRQGEVVASYTSDLSVMVWRDANLVGMISTYHHLQVGIQNKYNKLTYKPKIVMDYNKSMGGVDRKDQFLSAHPVERSRNKIWYKKVFSRLLSSAIFNSFIIFATQNPKVSHRAFRIRLAEDLLKLHRGIDLTTEPRLFTTKTGQMTIRTNARPTVDHDHYPARSNIKKARCWVCTRRKRDTRTIWKCIECGISLCIEHCFREYHKTMLQ